MHCYFEIVAVRSSLNTNRDSDECTQYSCRYAQHMQHAHTHVHTCTIIHKHVYPCHTCKLAHNTHTCTYTHVHTCTHTYTHTCTYIRTHMDTHMYMHTHTRTHTYLHTYAHTCTYTCTCKHTCTHTHAHTHIHTHIRTHMHIHMYMHTHMYTHTYTHVHTHTYTHTYAHTCTHTVRSVTYNHIVLPPPTHTQSSQAGAKREDIERELMSHLSTRGDSSTISNGRFSICSDSTSVTYRGSIEGTATTSSQQFLSQLQEWVNGNPIITVLSVEMEIDSSCPVRIDSFNAPRCGSGTTISLIIIVAASCGGVALLAICCIVVIVLCFWRKRRTKKKSFAEHHKPRKNK